MKTISLWQPWATLLVSGQKRIETRGWRTAYCGPLLIHAAKYFPTESMQLCIEEPFFSALVSAGYGMCISDLPRGALIGRVDLVDCQFIGYGFQLPGEPELSFGDYSWDRFAWITENPVTFATPIPYRGQQLLFDVPNEVLKEVCHV